MVNARSFFVRHVWQGSSLRLLARIVGGNGELLNAAAFSGGGGSIEVWVRDGHTGEYTASGEELSPSEVVVDGDGEFNFQYVLDGGFLPNGSRTYFVTVVFTPSDGVPDGEPFPVVWEVITKRADGLPAQSEGE